MLKLHLLSHLLWSSSQDTHFLIITQPDFREALEKTFPLNLLHVDFLIKTVTNTFQAGAARLDILDYAKLKYYDKVLYLDTDTLITGDLGEIWKLPTQSHFHALCEGSITHSNWGKEFFTPSDYARYRDHTAFSTGVLLFSPHPWMYDFFQTCKQMIRDYVESPDFVEYPYCLEQPFIVYNSFQRGIIDNKKMIGLVCFNPHPHMVSESLAVAHFMGGPGDAVSKWDKMTCYMGEKLKIRHIADLPIPRCWGQWAWETGDIREQLKIRHALKPIHREVYNWLGGEVEFEGDECRTPWGTAQFQVDISDNLEICTANLRYIGKILNDGAQFIVIELNSLEVSLGKRL